jgi:GAF domain-containing protein/HAMP domain-containing protein
MTTLDTQTLKRDAITLRRRNGFIAAILVAIAALVNAFIAFSIASKTQLWQSWADLTVVIIFVLLATISAVRIQGGHIDQGAKLLIASLLIALALRSTLTEGFGFIFGIIAAVLASIIAILALPSSQTGLYSGIGILTGAGIILFDLYAPPYRQAPDPLLTKIYPIIGIALALLYFGVLIRNARRLSLYTKITSALLVAALIPTIVLGFIGNRTLQTTLSQGQNEVLLGSALQVANSLDAFIQSNLNAIRVEGQTPIFSEYLITHDSRSLSSSTIDFNAIQALRALNRKDLIFIESYALLDYRGINLLDTQPSNIGTREYNQRYYYEPYKSGLPYVSSVEYSPDKQNTYIYFSAPVRDVSGQIVGVIRVKYNAYKFQQLVNQFNNTAGPESFAAVLDENFVFLAHGYDTNMVMKYGATISYPAIASLQTMNRLPPGPISSVSVELPGLEQGLQNSKDQPIFDAMLLKTPGGTDVQPPIDTVGVSQMKTEPWYIVFAQSKDVFDAPLRNQTRSLTLLGVLIASLVTVVALWITRALTQPISQLSETATLIAEGDLNARARVSTSDEIGDLASTFNIMTTRLRDLVNNLEVRVAERTEQLERRAVQLRTATEVGNAAANIREIETLLNQVTHLISDRFGFYHVGIFLLDEHGEYAVLQAANSPGGQNMLARNHKLKVGELGLVGYATGSGKPRIALDVGKDAVFFNNPDLPDTRSEMALPLIAGGEILGALDVQSMEEAAFSEEDITTLQILADQVAVAIENARLFDEGQSALEAAGRAYGELSRDAWRKLLQSKPGVGYIGRKNQVREISGEWKDELALSASEGRVTSSKDGKSLGIPIEIRGEFIGSIRLQKSANEPTWSQDEIELAQTLAGQISSALESARLYAETQRRAERERLVTEITTKIRSTNDPQTMLQTAISELKDVLGATHVQIVPQTISNQQTQHIADSEIPPSESPE